MDLVETIDTIFVDLLHKMQHSPNPQDIQCLVETAKRAILCATISHTSMDTCELLRSLASYQIEQE